MLSKIIFHDSGYGFMIDNFTLADPPAAVFEPNIILLLGYGLIDLGIYRWGRMRK